MSDPANTSTGKTPAEPGKRRIGRVILALAGVLISAGFVYLIVSKVDIKQVLGELRQVNLPLLSTVLLSTFCAHLVMALRMRVLMKGVAEYSVYRVYKSVLIGFAGNNVLPLRMGELVRIDYLARHGNCPHSTCLAVVGVERLFDLLCVVLLFFFMLPIVSTKMPNVEALTGVVVLVAVGLSSVIIIGRNRDRFVAICRFFTRWAGERFSNLVVSKAEVFAAGPANLRSLKTLGLTLLASFGFWGVAAISVTIAMHACGVNAPWYGAPIVLVFAGLGVMLPSSPAFIGTYHYFVGLAVVFMGNDQAAATSFAIVSHAMGIFPFTAVALVLLFGEVFRGQKAPPADR